MIDRRNFICGCSALALFGGAETAHSEESKESYTLCGVTSTEFKSLAANDHLYSFEERHNVKFRKTSENILFEDAFMSVRKELSSEFNVSPIFRYIESTKQIEIKAAATCETLPGHENSDGTVIFGVNLILDALKHKAGDISILAVCAHEFAHIAAFKKKLLPCYTTGLPFEMHADYLTGYYLGKYERGLEVELDLTGTIELWDSFTPASASHGTKKMRREALNHGYYLANNSANTNFDNAFDAATAYIKRYQLFETF